MTAAAVSRTVLAAHVQAAKLNGLVVDKSELTGKNGSALIPTVAIEFAAVMATSTMTTRNQAGCMIRSLTGKPVQVDFSRCA